MLEKDETKSERIDLALTKNQETFCWLYANPPPIGAPTTREAYAKAFPDAGKNSTGSYMLLKVPAIQRRISEIQQMNAERSSVKAEQVIAEYARMAFAKITDYIRWDARGNSEVIPSNELTADQAAAIREFFGRESWKAQRVRLHDKIAALDRLAKYLGLFTDKVDVTSGGQPIGSLTNAERVDRIVAIVERARTRRTLSSGDDVEE
jgi:phage terminase small subunit